MIEAGPGEGPGTRARIVVLEHGADTLVDEDALTDRVRTARPDVLIVEAAPPGSRDHASLLVALAGAAELRHLAWLPTPGRTERWVAARWPVAATEDGFAIGSGSLRVDGDRIRDALRWDCVGDVGRAPAVENAAGTLGVLVCPPWEVIRSGSGDDAGVLPSDMLRIELGRVAADPDDH